MSAQGKNGDVVNSATLLKIECDIQRLELDLAMYKAATKKSAACDTPNTGASRAGKAKKTLADVKDSAAPSEARGGTRPLAQKPEPVCSLCKCSGSKHFSKVQIHKADHTRKCTDCCPLQPVKAAPSEKKKAPEEKTALKWKANAPSKQGSTPSCRSQGGASGIRKDRSAAKQSFDWL
ncbi:hypothetical protein M885DRAFT_566625 [Pelagophyceae sp. CCMP2097]|nr:hypothetical protein M885DRAFT_566625 [Pelagophyceae sp. CCMP2097]